LSRGKTAASRFLIAGLLIFVIMSAAVSAAGCLPGSQPPGGGTVQNPPSPPGSSPGPGGTPDPGASQPGTPQPALASSVEVHFLNVGQGDSILIKSSAGGTALIDGGPRSAGAGVVTYLRAQGVERLDLLIATHAHEDHVGGLVNVLGAFPVSRVIDAGMPHTSDTYGAFLAGVEIQVLAGGCVYETPEEQTVTLAPNATITVLGPSGQAQSLNNSSVVCRLDFGATSLLFTGDAETQAEQALIAAGKPLTAGVLKVGHHGSSTSTSSSFLAAVSPVHAVISVGKNTYGHPSTVTLNRLAGAGVTIHRTDVSGHIVFHSDGNSLQVVGASGRRAAYAAWSGEGAVAVAAFFAETATAATAGVSWR
jgi:competence protein ComEC